MPFNIFNAPVELLHDELFDQKKIAVSVLRLDKIHPVVSGNKLFKLYYFLEAAQQSSHKKIITFGGAFSNHLVATAFACREYGLKSTGIVRGEKPEQLSHTLTQCIEYGMEIKFISRADYLKKETRGFIKELSIDLNEAIVIPEGGYHALGASGAALIYDVMGNNTFTHICTAAGTATTLAGLVKGAQQQEIIGVPVLKGMADINERLDFLLGKAGKKEQLQILNNYHFGGYAKKTAELIGFMNYLWQQHRLPTDFVYTGKLFFAIYDKIKNNYFTPGSHILCLHTGGLQGNNSLPKGTLLF
jgi:1-aminocyclopropane-1-carboxylate deaminase/D-cysteine desulfhydrase-like pyridoxal-dependent ACC family enzyme